MLLERRDTRLAEVHPSAIRNLVGFLKRRLRETDEIGSLSDGRLLVMMPHTQEAQARVLQKSLIPQLVEFLRLNSEHTAWMTFGLVSWQPSYTTHEMLDELSHDLRPLYSPEVA